MPEILVFNNGEASPIASVLQSINSDFLVKEKTFSPGATGEDLSKLQCIVLAFPANDIDSLYEASLKLKKFIETNKINPKIPVMPIVYEAKLQKQSVFKGKSGNLANNFPQINFLEEILIWLETESAEQFKNKMLKAEYKPAALSDSKNNNYDLSDKGAAIGNAIAIGISILLGVILGPIVGGLVGGLALGGPIAGIIGAVIGLVVGPLFGVLFTISLITLFERREVAKIRSEELQEKREWQEGVTLWQIFTANFFPEVSNSNTNQSLEFDSQENFSSQKQRPDELRIGYSAIKRNSQNNTDDVEVSSDLSLSS